MRPRNLLVPLIAAFALLAAPLAHADAHYDTPAPIVKAQSADAVPVAAADIAPVGVEMAPVAGDQPAGALGGPVVLVETMPSALVSESEGYLPDRSCRPTASCPGENIGDHSIDGKSGAQRGPVLLC